MLENFLVKAAGSTLGEERDKALKAVVDAYVDEVSTVAKNNAGTKYVLIDPILRPKIDWYDESLNFIKKCHKDLIQAFGLTNISRADIISRASQQFEQDGVHLAPAAGKIFVEAILEASEKVFKAAFVDLDKDLSGPSVVLELKLEVRLCRLKNEVEERRWYDNLIFARTREELDTIANKAKEDRIVMTGLTSSTPPPREWGPRKEWLRLLVVDTLKKILPTSTANLALSTKVKTTVETSPWPKSNVNRLRRRQKLESHLLNKGRKILKSLEGSTLQIHSVCLLA